MQMSKHFRVRSVRQLNALSCARQHRQQVQHAVRLQTVLPVEDHDLGREQHGRHESRVVCDVSVSLSLRVHEANVDALAGLRGDGRAAVEAAEVAERHEVARQIHALRAGLAQVGNLEQVLLVGQQVHEEGLALSGRAEDGDEVDGRLAQRLQHLLGGLGTDEHLVALAGGVFAHAQPLDRLEEREYTHIQLERDTESR